MRGGGLRRTQLGVIRRRTPRCPIPALRQEHLGRDVDFPAQRVSRGQLLSDADAIDLVVAAGVLPAGQVQCHRPGRATALGNPQHHHVQVVGFVRLLKEAGAVAGCDVVGSK